MSSYPSRLHREDFESMFGSQPFTFADAEDQGISARRLRTALTRGEVTHLRRGVYQVLAARLAAESNQSNAELIAKLAAHIEDLRRRGHSPVIGGLTAAHLWGIPWIGDDGLGYRTTPTLMVHPSPHLRKGRRGQVLLRFDAIPAEHITTFCGLPITNPLRTGCDVARATAQTPAAALVPLAGAARVHIHFTLAGEFAARDVSENDITSAARDPKLTASIRREIEHIIARSPRRGVRMTRLARDLVDPRLESALESLSYANFLQSGLPTPQLQVDIVGESGALYRVDFLFGRVIGEADGMVKYSSPASLVKEKARQVDLEAKGYGCVRWTWNEMWERPHVVTERIRREYAKAPPPRRL